jgi:hypothetical protein
MKDLILITILFADDQVTAACTEDELQRDVYAVNTAATECTRNLKISVNIKKTMAKRSANLTTKLVINNQTTEEANSFNYLPIYLLIYQWSYSPLLDFDHFFSFLILYRVGRTP